MTALITVIVILAVLLALYLFAIKGRKTSAEMKALTVWDYAHRGLHQKPFADENKNSTVPENSLTAFKMSANAGYGAELDVHLLKDGNIAVIHDSKLIRTTGAEGMIEDLTIEDLKKYNLEGTTEHIPSFREVLEIFQNKAPLIIELKTAGNNGAALCRAVCAVLKDYKGQFCIESFDPRCLMWLKKHRPEIIRGQLAQNFIKNTSGFTKVMDIILTSLVLNFITKPDFIAYRFEDRNNLPYRLCTKFWKTQGAAWTITTRCSYQAAKSENLITIFEQFRP